MVKNWGRYRALRHRNLLALAAGLLVAVSALPSRAIVPAAPWEIPLGSRERATIQARAEAGDKGAQQAMAEIDTDWAGERPDYVAALYWFDKAAANPSPQTPTDYRPAWVPSSSDADRLRQFNAEHAALFAKAQTGDPQALYDFAWHTPHMASGLAGDAPLAHWLLLAARAGNADAQAQIGYLYLRAYYVRHLRRHDDNDAAREKTLPGGLGDFSVDLRPDEPIGFDDESAGTDIADAIFWLGKAAAKNAPQAQYNLGLAYAVSGPTRNMTAASLWLHHASFSEWDLPVTACDLDLTGRLAAGPEAETGATPDPVAAFQCYDRVKAYHPGAYFMLGYMSHRGLGVPRDDGRAVQMLEQAERYSDWRPDALHELSLIYRDNTTLKRDPVKAVVFQALAEAAPVTPYMYCGTLQKPDDKGGPLALERHNIRAARDELDSLYRALTPAQQSMVRSQLSEQVPGMRFGDGQIFMPPLPMPLGCT